VRSNILIIKSVAGAERCGATKSVEFFTLPIIHLSGVIKAFFPGSAYSVTCPTRAGKKRKAISGRAL
jgi:hypothetical protein